MFTLDLVKKTFERIDMRASDRAKDIVDSSFSDPIVKRPERRRAPVVKEALPVAPRAVDLSKRAWDCYRTVGGRRASLAKPVISPYLTPSPHG